MGDIGAHRTKEGRRRRVSRRGFSPKNRARFAVQSKEGCEWREIILTSYAGLQREEAPVLRGTGRKDKLKSGGGYGKVYTMPPETEERDPEILVREKGG